MYKIGCIPGKFLPPQSGHLEMIDRAADLCEKLYVVICEKPAKTIELCKDAGMEVISYEMRKKWFEEYYKNQPKIKFLYLDESNLPTFPDGTMEWSRRLKNVVGEPIDAKFFGEEIYRDMNEKYFPESAAILIKRGVETPDISATQIRQNPEKYLKFVIPTAREYFKKIIANKGENK